MEVLLVRHAEAIDAEWSPTEQARWLTNAGRRSMMRVGTMLSGLSLRLSCIYTSPLTRAVQTAEILAATQEDFDGPVEIAEALSSDRGTTAQALAPLEHAPADAAIALVTHMPKVAVLAGHLCRVERVGGFKTGACCLIRLEDGVGQFQWMLDPEELELRRR